MDQAHVDQLLDPQTISHAEALGNGPGVVLVSSRE